MSLTLPPCRFRAFCFSFSSFEVDHQFWPCLSSAATFRFPNLRTPSSLYLSSCWNSCWPKSNWCSWMIRRLRLKSPTNVWICWLCFFLLSWPHFLRARRHSHCQNCRRGYTCAFGWLSQRPNWSRRRFRSPPHFHRFEAFWFVFWTPKSNPTLCWCRWNPRKWSLSCTHLLLLKSRHRLFDHFSFCLISWKFRCFVSFLVSLSRKERRNSFHWFKHSHSEGCSQAQSKPKAFLGSPRSHCKVQGECWEAFLKDCHGFSHTQALGPKYLTYCSAHNKAF